MSAKNMRLVAGIVAAAGLSASAFAGLPYKLIAAGGQDAPVPGGVTGDPVWVLTGSGLENPTLSDNGRLTFGGVMGGSTITTANDRGVWQYDGTSSIGLMIREGDAVPGLGGATYGAIAVSNARTNRNGMLAIGATLLGTGVVTAGTAASDPARNDNVLMAGTLAGGLAVVAQRGTAAPGTAGSLFDGTFSSGYTFQFSGLDNSGRVLFKSTLANPFAGGGDVVGTTNNEAIWTGLPGGLSIISRKGDAPTAGGGATVASYQFTLQMNGSGQAAYDTRYTVGTGTPVVTTHNDHSMWLYTPGSGSVLAFREGDTVPGTGGAVLDTTLANGWSPSIGFMGFNNAGQMMTDGEFLPGTGSPVVDTTNDRTILRWSGGAGLEIVARDGMSAAGTDASISTMLSSKYINNSGQVAYQVILAGGTSSTADDFALYVGTPGGAQLAVREGQPMPGIADAFMGTSGVQSSQFLFNNQGTIVFSVQMTGAGVTTADDQVLCSWNAGTGLRIIAREGEQVEVAPTVFKSVGSTFSAIASTNGDGRMSTFRDDGKLTMRVFMSDGSTTIMQWHIPVCVADVDDGSNAGISDGGVTIDDLIYYLSLFEAGNIAADVDDGSGTGTPDGGVTIDDLIYYLTRFEAGC
jgi:hypothetical protein